MADVQVLYAESVAATTAATTSWVDLASISSGNFTANKKYLIIANQICKHDSASFNTRARLVYGTTPTEFTDAFLSYEGLVSTQEHELSWMFLYTQPGTPETVKLQISSSSTSTVTNILSQIIAINMDDVGTSGTDYFWNEDLADYTMTATPTAKAITASFTPNGTDRWLFIGHMIHDVVSLVDEIGFELYDSVAGVLNKGWIEGEDATNDLLGQNLFWVGVPTNAARTLAVQPVNEAGSNVMLASRVIAINLAKFAQSASAFDATEVDPASAPSFTTVATIAPTPSVTGNWVVIAFMVNDVNETTTDLETRLQINASGGGLADDPPYTNTAPGIDTWDTLDEVPFSVFNLVSLTSGASRTINFDVRQVAGTTGRVKDNGLVAFSVALAGGVEAAIIETATSSESPSAVATMPAEKTEANTAGDTPSAVATMPASDTESVSALDTISAGTVTSASITETTSASDSADAIFVITVEIAESATATETESVTVVFADSVTENLNATDSHAAIASMPASVTEAISAGDTPSAMLVGVVESAESAIAGDTTDASLIHTADMAEPINAIEGVSASAVFAAASTETASTSDTPSAVFTATPAQAETITAADAASAVYTATPAQAESAIAGDTTDASLIHTADMAEPINAIEGVSASAVFPAAVGETVSASEVSDWEASGGAVQTESVTASDSPSAVIGAVADMAEVASANDVFSVTVEYAVYAVETSTMTDSLSAYLMVGAEVIETVTSLDDSLASVGDLFYGAMLVGVRHDQAVGRRTDQLVGVKTRNL